MGILVGVDAVQSGKKKVRDEEENVILGPTVREGEHVFGVAHIFASFNDTFVVSVVNSNLFIGVQKTMRGGCL